MNERKTGDPKDDEERAGDVRIVAMGRAPGFVVPGPLTAGRPKPEPEERWTLGPGRHADAPEDQGGEHGPMATKKTGDPKDRDEHVGGARFVPVSDPFGVAVVVPGPLTAGRPKPEPEERWTLAPGHHPAAAADPAVDEPSEISAHEEHAQEEHESREHAPREHAPHVHGPVLSPGGTILLVPEPLRVGPPRPEPEERWTLAPGHRTEPPDHDVPVEPARVEPAPVEPVKATVTRPAPEGGEPQRP